jgi:ribonuclease-3
MSVALAALEARLGHRFADPALLWSAVTHLSHAAEHPAEGEGNQRLEFLGDAVLQILLAEELFRRHPADREGALSRRRSLLVNGPFLAGLAREVGLPAALRLGASEEATGGRERASNLGDAFEALVGALYLDAGLEETRRVVLRIYGDLDARQEAPGELDNPKGRLQELVQPRHGNHALRYDVTGTFGQDHAREYEVTVHFLDQAAGTGRGSSKKLAEEAAARAALPGVAAALAHPDTSRSA